MQRHVLSALVMGAFGVVSAHAEPLSLQPHRYAEADISRSSQPAYVAPQASRPPAPVAADRAPPVQYASNQSDPNLGGGFIEFLFSGGRLHRRVRRPT